MRYYQFQLNIQLFKLPENQMQNVYFHYTGPIFIKSLYCIAKYFRLLIPQNSLDNDRAFMKKGTSKHKNQDEIPGNDIRYVIH